jgi:RNA polymerase primary sigma factor
MVHEESMELSLLLPFASECDPDALDLAAIEEEPPGEVAADTKRVAEPCEEAISIYLRDIQKNKLLTADEEREVAAKIDLGDQAARAVMIVSNLRLVVKLAKRYMFQGLPYLDLIEEGNLGLIKAVDRFKLSKGCRFSTYATWWIRQSIERALVNQSRTIRLPGHISEDIGKMIRATRALVRKLNREPTVEEVAAQLGVEEIHLRKLMVLLKKTFSLDQPLGDSEEFVLGDTIEDAANLSAEELFVNLNRFELVSAWFDTLSSTEQNILTLRFGLDDQNPQTLDTIGRSYDLTRERIRQIEVKALEKLRIHVETEGSICSPPTERE